MEDRHIIWEWPAVPKRSKTAPVLPRHQAHAACCPELLRCHPAWSRRTMLLLRNNLISAVALGALHACSQCRLTSQHYRLLVFSQALVQGRGGLYNQGQGNKKWKQKKWKCSRRSFFERPATTTVQTKQPPRSIEEGDAIYTLSGPSGSLVPPIPFRRKEVEGEDYSLLIAVLRRKHFLPRSSGRFHLHSCRSRWRFPTGITDTTDFGNHRWVSGV